MIVAIPENNTASEIASYFYAHQRGDISQEQHHMETALWVSRNADQYRPVEYVTCPQELSLYVLGRTSNRRGYDQDLSKRIGNWSEHLLRCQLDNIQNMELLVWCAEKLIAGKALSGTVSIEGILKKYRWVVFPEEQYRAARKTQVLDSNSRKQAAEARAK